MIGLDALILAGGGSSRMGRDKALVEIDGQPLIGRQIATARATGGGTIFLSARAVASYPFPGCPQLVDRFPGAGPLAGIERGLAAAKAPLLLVLAVDLPAMDPAFLRWLAAGCEAGMGAVPWRGGRPEPLAAIYPRLAHPLAVESLERGEFAVHRFVERCRDAGLVRMRDIPPGEERLFRNVNTPGDLAETA